jgi:HEAT repeat protein
MNAAARTLAAVIALAVVGCSSFSRLRSGDVSVEEAEVAAAGRSDDPTLTAPLHAIVANRDRHPTAVLVAAIVALGQRGDPSSVAVLERVADDPREEVRWQTVLALRAIGGADADSLLTRIAANDPSEFVRDEAADPGQ